MRRPIGEDAIELISRVDLGKWQALAEEYGEIFSTYGDRRHPDKSFRHEKNYSKFFDLDRFVPYHLRMVRALDLDLPGPSKKVLDIGCGSGIFLFLCQCFGHQGLGIEIESEMYRKMADILGVKLRISPVLANQPMPEDLTGFDVISAIAIKFDRLDWGPQDATPWALGEWEFFLNDMAKRLNPGGKMLMKPNYAVQPTETKPGIYFEDPKIEPYLRSVSSFVTKSGDFIIPKESFTRG